MDSISKGRTYSNVERALRPTYKSNAKSYSCYCCYCCYCCYDSDESEEADPWGVLIHEAAMELRTKHNELVQSFQNDGFSEIDAKKQAFSEIFTRPSKGSL